MLAYISKLSFEARSTKFKLIWDGVEPEKRKSIQIRNKYYSAKT